MRDHPFPVLALVAEGAASAVDALQARTLRTAMALLMVAAGVCAVLVAGAALRGVAIRAGHDAASDGARGFVVYSWSGAFGREVPLGASDARAIASLPQVAAAVAHQTVVLPVGAGDELLPNVTIDAYERAGPTLAEADVLRGRWFTAAENAGAAPVVALDDRLAARLVGPSSALGAAIEIAHYPFRVIGVYHDAGSGLHAIVPLETARRILGAAPAWTDIVVRARDGVAMNDAEQAVAARLRRERHLPGAAPAGFVVAGADGLRAGTRTVPFVSRTTMASLAALGLTLGGLALLAFMMRTVRERTREIGLRKVLGATRAAILLEIVAESATLAIVGGTAGLAAGRVIAMLLAGATPIPASVSAAAALTALGMTIAAGAALGAPPGVRAARLDVVQALRGK